MKWILFSSNSSEKLGTLTKKIISFLTFLFTILHFLSLIVVSTKYQFVQELHTDNKGTYTIYLTCIYYIIGTITTAGYGDYTPSRTTSYLVIIGIQLLGLAFYGYSFQKAVEYMNLYMENGNEKDSKIEEFNLWIVMRDRQSPNSQNEEVTKKMTSFYQFTQEYNFHEFFIDYKYEKLPFSDTIELDEYLSESIKSKSPQLFKTLN